MKKTIFFSLICSLLLAASSLYAQVDSLQKAKSEHKKFYWGATFNNYWSSFEGENLPEYFYKPSLGTTLKVEYYFTDFLGISAGIGWQQRGTGIINRNHEEIPLGGRDSTYRERLRMNYVDLPIQLVARMPTPIAGGDVRIAGSVGIVPGRMFNATQIFHSVEDGFHEYTDHTNDLSKSDLAYTASIGADIFAGATILQVRLLGNWGTKNVFKNPEVYPGQNGKNRTYGIQLGFMF
jgi:hypothetical protein